ncbi:KamA family radical SAM protein [Candidatus Riflebacteria bacterium]
MKKAKPRKIVVSRTKNNVVRKEKKFGVTAEFSNSLKLLWKANPAIFKILKNANTLTKARNELFNYLNERERKILGLGSPLNIVEKTTVRESIRVFKSIIAPVNEMRTEISSLDCLWKLAREKWHNLKWKISIGFIYEFIHLFRGVIGKSGIYGSLKEIKATTPVFLKMEGRKAALKRSAKLDDISSSIDKHLKRFSSGLDSKVIKLRRRNRDRILKYFGGKKKNWLDYQWHLKHIIKDSKTLLDLIQVPDELAISIEKACKNKIPLGVTPYYLSLMDQKPGQGSDHAVRAQVLPPPRYVNELTTHKKNRAMAFDFMGEQDTSPEDLITRRYPMICILKPYNTCSQICVYCQRNWEIDECMSPDALAPAAKIRKALKWIEDHPAIGEVLLTGGDPVIMNNNTIVKILDALVKIKHIYRIRIGTRTPVVLPQRWTDSLIKVLARYHVPGRRELCIVTHFAHSYEITPEARDAVQKIRKAGMSVYNQQVFTMENSRRFESVKLRLDLKTIGVDPYYTFNMKGKEETMDYMVPIARILQEREEEARLLPGLDRTDEPVFNVPRLGKNHLRALQDHRLVMVRPDGRRVYELHAWEKNITPVPPYNYTDVSIYDYLQNLAERGENVEEYRNIWYYY